MSDRLCGAPPSRDDRRAGAAGQHSVRHRPAHGGQGPQRQRQLPRQPPLQGGERAESHVGLLHDLQPHPQADPHPAVAAPGPTGRPRLEESAHRGAAVRVPAGPARPASGGRPPPAAAGDVRRGGSLRAVRRLLQLLARRDHADVDRHHGEGPVQGQRSPFNACKVFHL